MHNITKLLLKNIGSNSGDIIIVGHVATLRPALISFVEDNPVVLKT